MVSNEEIEKTARLARLDLSEAELGKMRDELDRILDLVRKISELDIPEDRVKEAHRTPGLSMREDSVAVFRSEELMDLAPSTRDRLYEVPGVMEEVK